MKSTEREEGEDEEQWGNGTQFNKAASNQPITVKENISWCVSSNKPRKKE